MRPTAQQQTFEVNILAMHLRLLWLRFCRITFLRWKEHWIVLEYSGSLIVLEHRGRWQAVNCGSDNKRRSLEFFDRVDVVLNDRVDQALVKTVRGTHDDM